ncbi:MAG: rhodanese-like domain-containing protein [Eubacteriales bacterium]|nr:rhodanese-like domain-containing protein [Eubacteriales bacterium]
MKKLLSLLLILTILLTASVSVAAQTTTAVTSISASVKTLFTQMPDHSYKIAEKEFVDKIIAGQKPVILDIRGAADYAKGHIKGAVNLPWGTAISDNLSKIPQDQEVYVYCYTGQTAGQAVITLNLAGIKARSVNLGWMLGISKVAGVAAVTETTVNTLPAMTYAVDAKVQQAVTDYYAGLAKITDPVYKNYKISEKDLKTMLDAGQKPFILSVRKAEDFVKAHIQGAINMPYGKTTLNDLTKLPKNQKIIVYCYTGQTAGQTTAALRLMGYDAVSLNGGMGMTSNKPSGWANQAYWTVSSDPVLNAVKNYFVNMPSHIYKIAEKEFVAKVTAGDAMVVLDLRSAADYAKGHVKGAISIPFGTAISDNLTKIPQDKDVFIYCYTGQTAGQAVVTLNIAGIKARSVNLGWNLGIAKVAGAAAVTETTVNTLPNKTYKVDAAIAKAVASYYAGLSTIADARFKTYKVNEDVLYGMVDAREDFFLLSLQKPADYAKGHIKGAVSLAFDAASIESLQAAGVPTTKKIVVYCYTGQTAAQVVAAMRIMGYDAVSLNGGIGMPSNAPYGWTNKGFPLVTY